MKRSCSLSPQERLSELAEAATIMYGDDFEAVFSTEHDKRSRLNALAEVRERMFPYLRQQAQNRAEVSYATNVVERQAFRRAVLGQAADSEASRNGPRCDGRGYDEVRPLEAEVGVLPGLHGSALFSRGNTQVLATLTHGSPADAALSDSFTGPSNKHAGFFQYSFPPMATGSTSSRGGRTFGAPERREVGHAALVQRAFSAVLPSPDSANFPIGNAYRVAAEVLGSDGSSSMAAICASSLALLDGGVPIRTSIAGVAMGLLVAPQDELGEQQNRHLVLTDILGLEDGLGDMDLKIAGSRTGVTALQLDVKLHGGVPLSLISEAIFRSEAPLCHILQTMEGVLNEPRSLNSPNLVGLPRSERLEINSRDAGRIIGSKGANIQGIEKRTGARIDISKSGAIATITITAKDEESLNAAKDEIKQSTHTYEVGQHVQGIVSSLLDFGAVMSVGPGRSGEGLLHVSEIAHKRVASPSDVLQVGDKVALRIISVDPQGKLKFSRKACLPAPE